MTLLDRFAIFGVFALGFMLILAAVGVSTNSPGITLAAAVGSLGVLTFALFLNLASDRGVIS